jgi:hypothetical protein
MFYELHQASVLRITSFLLYINDLPLNWLQVRTGLFSDDINIILALIILLKLTGKPSGQGE